MRYKNIVLVLFIISIITFLPGFKPSQTYSLVPSTPRSIIFDVTSPTLELTLSQNSGVSINLSYYFGGNVVQIKQNLNFTNSLVLDNLSPGLYYLQILSSNLNEITIGNSGIYIAQIGVFVFLGLLNLYVFNKELKIRS